MDYRKLSKIVDGANEPRYFVELYTGRDGYSEDQVEGSSMTVSDFLSVLDQYDENYKVVFNNDNGYTYAAVTPRSIFDEGDYVYFRTSRDGYSPSQVIDHAYTLADIKRELEHYDMNAILLYCNDGGYTYGYVSEDRVGEGELEVEEEEESYSADEQLLNKLEDEIGDFSWYKGKEVPYGCWYLIEAYLIDEDLEQLVNKLKESFKGRITHFKKVNNHTYKFVIWDSEQAREEFSGE